ncbi:hypothetical protein [Streptomyces sp. WELS2]|uniref:hypothetical protein n=1 Tax=Streptomyces sp. WELS2 TaxID=2749435 RepID=UPI0015EFF5F8|nr:hypothetical protein [Streptomyces sp. WELS2]
MSRTVDIDLTFARAVNVSAFVQLLLESGMRASCNGEISYLIDDDGMFEWNKGAPSEVEGILSAMGHERVSDCTVGITLYFPDSSSGADFLFHPDRESVSCVIAVNPKLLEGSVFCDIGWYAARLIPWLEPLHLIGVETRDTR